VEEVLSGDYAISDGPLDPYGQELALGVDSRRYAIDAVIRASSASWSLSRMPVVDRNILRLALYEMIEEDDITVAVAIDEAVELAKAFGTDESPRFINGVLGSIAADVNAGVDVYEKARQVLHAAAKSQADERQTRRTRLSLPTRGTRSPLPRRLPLLTSRTTPPSRTTPRSSHG
jgi:N utilization substance protein B